MARNPTSKQPRRVPRLKEIEDILRPGKTVSEWDLLEGLYGFDRTHNVRTGNSGFLRGIRKEIRKRFPTARTWVDDHGTAQWLTADPPTS